MNPAMKEILRRIPIVALFAAFSLYTVYSIYDFKVNPDSKLGQAQGQLSAAEQENAKLQEQLTAAKQFFQTLSVKREELRALAVELDQMRTVLTGDLDVAGLIKMVVIEARRVGITVISIKPLPIVKNEYFDEQPFALEFHGVYAQLLVFLERLASLERIVRVDEFEIKRIGSTGPYIDLEGKVKIKAYRYKGSKADDLAKQGGSEKATPVKGGS